MPYDYEVKFNLDACIKKLGLNEQGRVQSFVTNEILKLSDPYVPLDEAELYENPGRLRNSGRVEGTDVVWSTPYARRLYYSKGYQFQGAPMRGEDWVDRMLQNGGITKIENGARRIASK